MVQGSKRCFRIALGLVALSVGGLAAQAQLLTPMGSFGGGDGWRAPNEILGGDSAGTTNNGNYNYLGTGALERGLAYNPVTGNLILVSRSTAGTSIRILNGQTGVDVGSLNLSTGIISGGTFAVNMVGVADDGAIYVNNLTTNVGTSAYKVYRWGSELSEAPTVYHNSTISGFAGTTPRLGDSFDVFGSGAGTTLVQGASGTGTFGYATITGSPTGTATVVACSITGSWTPWNRTAQTA